MKKRSMAAGLLLAAGLAPLTSGQVIVTEILANEAGGDTPGEWAEIYNTGSSPVDISGWRFADEDGNSPSDPFPDGFIIQPGEAVVIVGDGFSETDPGEPVITEADFFASWGATNAAGNTYRVIVQRDAITLANTASATNEVLRLIDAAGNTVDDANYENGTNQWPPTPNGASVMLGANFLDEFSNDLGCAWAVAIDGVDGAVTSTEVLTVNGLGNAVVSFSGENVASPGYVETSGMVTDCNNNGFDDSLDICNGFSLDCNGNGIPDECEPDCNNNGIPDECDFENDFTIDCDLDGVLDSCQIAANPMLDMNGNGQLDSCEAVEGVAIITEIMFDPFTSGDEFEYVEILNVSGAPLDISGWSLRDIELSGEQTDPIPAGTILDPGGIAVLTRSVTGDVDETRDDYIDAWGSTTPAGDPILWIPLENWGARATFGTDVTEVLSIVTDTNIVVDIVNYLNRTSNFEPLAGGWPGGDGHGSYFLDGTKLNSVDNDLGPNWRRSTDGLSGVIRSSEFDPADLPTWTNPDRSGEDYGTPGFIYAGAPQEPAGSVIITEIMASSGSIFPGEDPANPDALEGIDEWVEIYNTTGAAIDLSGWYLQDEDGRTGAIAPGSILGAGEVAIIFGDDNPLELPNPVAAFYDAWGCGYQVFTVNNWYTSNGAFGLSRLSNSPNFLNEILRIVDASGTPTDIANFDDDGFDWPVDSSGVNSDDNWSIYIFGQSFYNSVDNDFGTSWADSLAPIDGARISTATPIFNTTGNTFGSPGHLEGVQVPDLADCPPVACIGDLTTTGATLPGQPGFGVPDGVADLDDLGYFLGFFLNGDLSVDFTTTGATLPGQPGFGAPDGVTNLDDLGYYLNFWLQGCP